MSLVTAFAEARVPVVRPVLRRDGLIDDHLDFGVMKMGGGGRAFAYGAATLLNSVDVAKEWCVSAEPPNGAYLVEKVRYATIEPYLRDLPRAQASVERSKAKIQSLAQAFPPATLNES